jgi:hypothetical protein
MIKPVLLALALVLWGMDQDVKVATWSIGKPDTDTYESLSFWVKEEHRAYVRYAHGRSEDDTELQWLGPDTAYGRKAFRVSMPQPGAGSWVIAPGDSGITVIDRRTNSAKTYYWEDANPSGDSAGRCSICARNEREAQGWLRRYFLR